MQRFNINKVIENFSLFYEMYNNSVNNNERILYLKKFLLYLRNRVSTIINLTMKN